MKNCEHEFKRVGSAEDSKGLTNVLECKKCKETKTEYIENYFPTQEEIEDWIETAELDRRKDIRTLCYRCYSDMHNAGINIQHKGSKRSKCDKCSKPGEDYIVK